MYNRNTPIGAYSQRSARRYSNFSATSNGFTLKANSSDPSKGEVRVVEVLTINKDTTGTGSSGNDRGTQGSNDTWQSAGGNTTTYKKYLVTALPYSGYKFVGWNNASYIPEPGRKPVQVTLSRDMVFTAYFAKSNESTYTVNVEWDALKGSVNNDSMQVGVITARAGDLVTLTATPKSGYRFVKWTGGPSTVNGSTSMAVKFNVNNNYTIGAVFEAEDTVGKTPSVGTHTGSETQGSGGGGGIIDDILTPPEVPSNAGVVDTIMAYLEKYWWALLIVAVLIYTREGGRK